VRNALHLDYRLIGTAETYSEGDVERAVGAALLDWTAQPGCTRDAVNLVGKVNPHNASWAARLVLSMAATGQCPQPWCAFHRAAAVSGRPVTGALPRAPAGASSRLSIRPVADQCMARLSGVSRWHTIRLTKLSFHEYLQIEHVSLTELPKPRSVRDLFDRAPAKFHRTTDAASAYVGHIHDYLVHGGFRKSAQVDSIMQAQRLRRHQVAGRLRANAGPAPAGARCRARRHPDHAYPGALAVLLTFS